MRYKAFLLAVFFAFSGLPALAEDKILSRRPDGTGNPDATTCRPPQPLPQSRTRGPEVCKLNSQWALLRKNGQDISADGTQIIPDPQGTTVAPLNCRAMGGGASAGGGAVVCQ